MSKRMTHETDPATGITYAAGVEPLRARLVEKAKPLLGRTYPTVWCLVRYPSSGPRYVWDRIVEATVCRRRGHAGSGFCGRCRVSRVPIEPFPIPEPTAAQAARIASRPARVVDLPDDPGVF